MIGYFDTSALVSLLIDEPGTATSQQLADSCDALVSNRVTYVEASAALARAERMGRLESFQAEGAFLALERYWRTFRLVEVNEILVDRAALLSRHYALRGYDAIQCASAEMIPEDDVVACSGDRALLLAWRARGLTIRDTSPEW